MTAPFAPHFAEECWERLGHSDVGLRFDRGPAFDEALTLSDEITDRGAGQRQGARQMTVARDADEATVRALAEPMTDVQRHLDGQDDAQGGLCAGTPGQLSWWDERVVRPDRPSTTSSRVDIRVGRIISGAAQPGGDQAGVASRGGLRAGDRHQAFERPAHGALHRGVAGRPAGRRGGQLSRRSGLPA